jgi:hypothetical protein
MLVRDAGDAWQIVMQTDHGDLAGQIVAGWGGEGFRAPPRLASAVLAATCHDDGWAIWERRPRLDPETGAPRNFLGVPVAPHLAFYRAGVEVVCDDDRYAGLLVSMHMSGLYRQRYGVVPAGPMRLSAEERALADTFCDQEEERQAALTALLEVSEEERWHDYALLQVADLLSLFCALGDLEGGTASGAAEAGPTADGASVRVALEPLGPWRLRAAPFPFAAEPLALTMARRLLPKRDWADDDAFRADLAACPVETVRIFVQG